MGHFKTLNFTLVLYCWGHFCPPGFGPKSARIRIHNTGPQHRIYRPSFGHENDRFRENKSKMPIFNPIRTQRRWYQLILDEIRSRTFECLWGPGIDSKEWILPAYVAWRAGTITLFLLGS